MFRHGETGSDTVSDFSTTDGDKLDIQTSDRLRPVDERHHGFRACYGKRQRCRVSVDVDGPAGGAANFVTIATLTGMSALGGTESDLLANGNLLAHV